MVKVKGMIKGSRTKDLQNAHSQHDNIGNLKERPRSCRQDKSLFLKAFGPDEYVKIKEDHEVSLGSISGGAPGDEW